MYRLLRPILFRLPPEAAHNLTFRALRLAGPLARGWARLWCGPPDPRLRVELAGLSLPGPIGLAAGLDKDGVLAPFWANLGFGFVELGTVTAHPQPGNPKPRMFRLPEAHALINRMGFNNRGSAELAARLDRLRGGRGLGAPCGVNIGKSKVTPLDQAVEDYATSARRVAAVADYLVINVSSPNTPGLRELQDADHLAKIVAAVRREAEGRPVFVKLAPDLADEALDDAVDVSEQAGCAGIIATNTTIERYGLADVGAGGLSGRPLHARALEVVARVAARTELPVVAVGGIDSVDGVCAFLARGARAVQVYTGFIYQGPGLAARLNRELLARMESLGARDIAELARILRDPQHDAHAAA